MPRNINIIMLVCCLFLIISQKNLLAETSNSNKNFIINKTREISQNIKCLVCQNQSIDESNSEIAKDLKVLIKDKLKDGVTDEEIYKFLRDRYGDTILLKPPLETNTILLWFLPFIILVFGSFFVIRFFKSNYK
jgi:cytochrome c-type biogenesis protein CcmH/NrfF